MPQVDVSFEAVGADWRSDRGQYRTFAWLTVLWIAMFAVRFAVQFALYQNDDVGGLGVARIIMGWPMFAVGLLGFVHQGLTHLTGITTLLASSNAIESALAAGALATTYAAVVGS